MPAWCWHSHTERDMGYPLEIENVPHRALAGVAHDRGNKLVPRVVCLCGSTRFMAEFHAANARETLAGKIVLTVAVVTSGVDAPGKDSLDLLHMRKIDLADEILVLNVGGYIGESTAREIRHAENNGKIVRYLEPTHTRPPSSGVDAERLRGQQETPVSEKIDAAVRADECGEPGDELTEETAATDRERALWSLIREVEKERDDLKWRLDDLSD